jgi:hypothetical protein
MVVVWATPTTVLVHLLATLLQIKQGACYTACRVVCKAPSHMTTAASSGLACVRLKRQAHTGVQYAT